MSEDLSNDRVVRFREADLEPFLPIQDSTCRIWMKPPAGNAGKKITCGVIRKRQ